MGRVIGKNRVQLKEIIDHTGAEFKTDTKSNQDGALYIKGSIESQKRAVRKIKEIVVSPMSHRFSFEILFLMGGKRRGSLYRKGDISTKVITESHLRIEYKLIGTFRM